MRNILLVCLKRVLKPVVIDERSTAELKKIDISDTSNHLPLNEMDFGNEALQLVNKLPSETARKESKKNMRDAFIVMLQYIQKKLPFDSSLLKDVSCLTPSFRKKSWTVKAIGRLAILIPHAVSDREVSLIKDQWKLYQEEDIEETWITSESKPHRIDRFWSHVLAIKGSTGKEKYALLSKVVKSFLSLPNGNASVERSLSDNKNVLTCKRNQLSKECLTGLRLAKEYARTVGGAHNINAMSKDMITAVRDAHNKYKERKQKEKEEEERKKKEEDEQRQHHEEQSKLIEKAKKNCSSLDKKECVLKKDRTLVDKEFEVSCLMLNNAKSQLEETVKAGHLVGAGADVVRELLDSATKSLQKANKHRKEQDKVSENIGHKRKNAFKKLMETVSKKQK